MGNFSTEAVYLLVTHTLGKANTQSLCKWQEPKAYVENIKAQHSVESTVTRCVRPNMSSLIIIVIWHKELSISPLHIRL